MIKYRENLYQPDYTTNIIEGISNVLVSYSIEKCKGIICSEKKEVLKQVIWVYYC